MYKIPHLKNLEQNIDIGGTSQGIRGFRYGDWKNERKGLLRRPWNSERNGGSPSNNQYEYWLHIFARGQQLTGSG